jgi:hypothetical protein
MLSLVCTMLPLAHPMLPLVCLMLSLPHPMLPLVCPMLWLSHPMLSLVCPMLPLAHPMPSLVHPMPSLVCPMLPLVRLIGFEPLQYFFLIYPVGFLARWGFMGGYTNSSRSPFELRMVYSFLLIRIMPS